MDSFPKTYKWPTGTWKVAYHRNSSQSTMRYHFILVRMAILEKSQKNNMFLRMWREGGSPEPLTGM